MRKKTKVGLSLLVKCVKAVNKIADVQSYGVETKMKET